MYDERIHGRIDGDQIQTIVKMDVVPLWLWALVSSLTILAIIYAIAIAVFNIVKRTDRYCRKERFQKVVILPKFIMCMELSFIPSRYSLADLGWDPSRPKFRFHEKKYFGGTGQIIPVWGILDPQLVFITITLMADVIIIITE